MMPLIQVNVLGSFNQSLVERQGLLCSQPTRMFPKTDVCVLAVSGTSSMLLFCRVCGKCASNWALGAYLHMSMDGIVPGFRSSWDPNPSLPLTCCSFGFPVFPLFTGQEWYSSIYLQQMLGTRAWCSLQWGLSTWVWIRKKQPIWLFLDYIILLKLQWATKPGKNNQEIKT